MSSKVAITDTYFESERFLHSLVNTTVQKYGVDRDLVLSAAFLGFMQAYESYRTDKGAEFNTWMGTKIKSKIWSLIRQRIREAKRFDRSVDLNLVPESITDKFDPEEWLKGLPSDDARVVGKLVLFPPIDVVVTIHQLGGESAVNWRIAIREFLGYEGWNRARVVRAFREVKENL